MSNTTHRLHTAAFPQDYAEILIETLGIGEANFLSVKDALYHFRHLDDDQAAEAMRHIAEMIRKEEESPTKPTFDIEHLPEENPGRVYVMVDNKYDVSIIRTEDGLVVRIVPYEWDDPIDSLEVFDSDIEELGSQAE